MHSSLAKGLALVQKWLRVCCAMLWGLATAELDPSSLTAAVGLDVAFWIDFSLMIVDHTE